VAVALNEALDHIPLAFWATKDNAAHSNSMGKPSRQASIGRRR
jgi:hypothetical protein